MCSSAHLLASSRSSSVQAKAGSGVVASPSDTVEAPAPEPAPAPAPAPASDQAPLQKREEMAVSDSAPSPEGPPGGKEDGTKFWRSGGLAPAPDEEEPAADEEGETSAKTANAGEGEGVCLGVSDVLAYRHVYEARAHRAVAAGSETRSRCGCAA